MIDMEDVEAANYICIMHQDPSGLKPVVHWIFPHKLPCVGRQLKETKMVPHMEHHAFLFEFQSRLSSTDAGVVHVLAQLL